MQLPAIGVRTGAIEKFIVKVHSRADGFRLVYCKRHQREINQASVSASQSAGKISGVATDLRRRGFAFCLRNENSRWRRSSTKLRLSSWR